MRLCIIEDFMLPFHQGKGTKHITIHGIIGEAATRQGERAKRNETIKK
jgi:hypothetical protein